MLDYCFYTWDLFLKKLYFAMPHKVKKPAATVVYSRDEDCYCEQIKV